MRTRDSFSTRSASASLIFQGLQVQALKPASVEPFPGGRLVAGEAVVNVAFLGLAEIEDAASTLAVNEDSGFRVGALPFCFGSSILAFKQHVFGVAVHLPCGSL